MTISQCVVGHPRRLVARAHIPERETIADSSEPRSQTADAIQWLGYGSVAGACVLECGEKRPRLGFLTSDARARSFASRAAVPRTFLVRFTAQRGPPSKHSKWM